MRACNFSHESSRHGVALSIDMAYVCIVWPSDSSHDFEPHRADVRRRYFCVFLKVEEKQANTKSLATFETYIKHLRCNHTHTIRERIPFAVPIRTLPHFEIKLSLSQTLWNCPGKRGEMSEDEKKTCNKNNVKWCKRVQRQGKCIRILMLWARRLASFGCFAWNWDSIVKPHTYHHYTGIEKSTMH